METKLPKEVIEEISKIGEVAIKSNEMHCEDCKHYDKGVCKQRPNGEVRIFEDGTKEEIGWEEVKKDGHCSYWDEINNEEEKGKLLECYRNIIEILKKYCDLNEEYYPLISTWIIGTWMHDSFETYPYLFLNAMKGSGKTRLLKLITKLSKDGRVISSLSEATLFRTQGCIGIDEFEGIGRKGSDNLRELLNACYKKGNKVIRWKKVKEDNKEEMVADEFEIFRPITMANIWGMENVLGDRCISIIIERSNNKQIIKRMENFEYDLLINNTLTTLTTLFDAKNPQKCRVCSVGYMNKVYIGWDRYITDIYHTHIPHTTNTTLLHTLYNKIDKSNIEGRYLELSFPLFIIANELGEEIINNLIEIIKEIVQDKTEDNFSESKDVSLIDFVSQEINTNYQAVTTITNNFKSFMQINEDWLNKVWVGLALKRLGLIRSKRRLGRGVEIQLNIEKAQKKILMFK